jgi:hypothetical protein
MHGCASSEGWRVQQETRPAGVKVRGLVTWIAGWRETKILKPIDNFSYREGVSEQAVTKVNA